MDMETKKSYILPQIKTLYCEPIAGPSGESVTDPTVGGGGSKTEDDVEEWTNAHTVWDDALDDKL